MGKTNKLNQVEKLMSWVNLVSYQVVLVFIYRIPGAGFPSPTIDQPKQS